MIHAHFAPTHLEDAVDKNPLLNLENNISRRFEHV